MTSEVIERTEKFIDIYNKDDIINGLAKETPQTVIAKQNNITQPRVSQLKKENQDVIDQKKAELLKELPSVVDIVKSDVRANGKLSTNLHDNINNLSIAEKIQLKAQLDKTSVNILKIASHEGTGIFPSHAPFININQDNSTQNVDVSDNVLNLFALHAKELRNTEAVDIEGVSDNEGNSDNVDNS